jgi:hypothetical protein
MCDTLGLIPSTRKGRKGKGKEGRKEGRRREGGRGNEREGGKERERKEGQKGGGGREGRKGGDTRHSKVKSRKGLKLTLYQQCVLELIPICLQNLKVWFLL